MFKARGDGGFITVTFDGNKREEGGQGFPKNQKFSMTQSMHNPYLLSY